MYWIYRIFKDKGVRQRSDAALLVKSNCWMFSLSNLSLTLELKKRPRLTRMPSCYLERNSSSMYRQRATFLMGARLRRVRLEERNGPLALREVFFVLQLIPVTFSKRYRFYRLLVAYMRTKDR